MKTVQIKVSGKVQGVGFRYYTQKKAQEFNIKGFVQNKPNGSVYIEAEGRDVDVDTFADWCARGPEWSRVSQIVKSEMPPIGFKNFEVR